MFDRLTKRHDFLRVGRSPSRIFTDALIIQATPSGCAPPGDGSVMVPSSKPCRVGLTVSRKIGGAVQRNFVKRRLREALRHTFRDIMVHNLDVVIVARAGVKACTFTGLCVILHENLPKIAAKVSTP